MKQILSLYSLKGIACIMVVMGHIPSIFRSPLSPLLNGVPLFLMISGYFLYTPDKEELARKVLIQLKKIVCIIICVHAVYAIYSAVRAYLSPTYLFPIQSRADFLNWLFFGVKIGSGVLWYLHAYAWSLVFLWLFSRYGKTTIIHYLPLLLIANLLLGRYLFLFPFEIPNSNFRNNCFTSGLPYLSIGYLIHMYKNRLECIALQKWRALICVCLVGVYAEISLLTLFECNNHFGNFILGIPFSVSLFALMALHPTWELHPLLVRLGRDHSANIYYWHMLVASLCSWMGLYIKPIQVLIVFALSLVLSVAIRALRAIS